MTKDLETDAHTNSPPSFYAELGDGEYSERKAAIALDHSRSSSEYGRLFATVENAPIASRVTHRFIDENGLEWVRYSRSASGWCGWLRVYDDAAYRSSPGVASGIGNSGPLATEAPGLTDAWFAPGVAAGIGNSGCLATEAMPQTAPRRGTASFVELQGRLATRDVVDFQSEGALGVRLGPIMRTIGAVDGWLNKASRRKRPGLTT